MSWGSVWERVRKETTHWWEYWPGSRPCRLGSQASHLLQGGPVCCNVFSVKWRGLWRSEARGGNHQLPLWFQKSVVWPEQVGDVTEHQSHLRGALRETIPSRNEGRRNGKCKFHVNSWESWRITEPQRETGITGKRALPDDDMVPPFITLLC